MLEPAKPAPEHPASYLAACRRMHGHIHDNYLIHDPERFAEWSATIFDRFELDARGEDLPAGFVPSVTRRLTEEIYRYDQSAPQAQ